MLGEEPSPWRMRSLLALRNLPILSSLPFDWPRDTPLDRGCLCSTMETGLYQGARNAHLEQALWRAKGTLLSMVLVQGLALKLLTGSHASCSI